jgi:hypothetical protein
MNIEEIAARIQSELGPHWPRIKPIPLGVLTPLCDALWDEGKLPTRSILKQCLPAMSMQALAPAGGEWRKEKRTLPDGARHSWSCRDRAAGCCQGGEPLHRDGPAHML